MKWWHFGLFAVGALAIGVGAAEVHSRIGPSYDDPAVAICEYTKFKGVNPPANLYSRTSTSFAGSVVTINYSSAPLNTKPQSLSYSCTFKAGYEGSFVLDRQMSPEAKRCDDTVTKIMAEFKVGFTEERRKEALATVESCRDLIQREAVSVMKAIVDEDFTLHFAGIYPIKPENTKLKK